MTDVIQTSDSITSPAPGVRTVGVLLVLYAVTTLVSVAGRIAADADQPTLAQSFVAIAESQLAYGIGWFARIASGVALAAAAVMLLRTVTTENRSLLGLALGLFVISGIFTLASGVCSVLLAAYAPGAEGLGFTPSGSQETVDALRWVFGKAGFTAAGLALIAASRPQWQAGGVLLYLSPVTAVLGLAMLFIWVDSATALHNISGPAFLIWLALAALSFLAGQPKGFLAEAHEST